MKMFLITDHTETYTGLRLAGVDGTIVHTNEEFQQALENAMADASIGLILITDELHKEHSDQILNLKLKVRSPLITSIPDRGDTTNAADSISQYIASAVGLKL